MRRGYKWQSAGMWVDQKCAIVQMPLVTHCGNSFLDKCIRVVFNFLMGSKVNPLNRSFSQEDCFKAQLVTYVKIDVCVCVYVFVC